MKLLFVESSLAIYGGIERVLTDKLNWLVEYGKCEIRLLLANQGIHPIVFPLNSKIEVHNIGIMFHQIYRYSGVKRYLKKFQLHKRFRECLHDNIESFSPDIIIFTRLEFAYDLINIKGSIPVVYESHNSYIASKFEKNGMMQKIKIRWWHHALKKVQMIVALTNGDALEWKKLNPHVRVIPNVVHLNNTGCYSDYRNKSAIFVGRYSMQKDIGSLLKVWGLVHKRFPDWLLHIYGGYGDEQNAIIAEIKHMNANIIVHQPTSNIHEKYVESSMLLMTSRYEPFGLVLPEAMSCGLPVVSFDCPYGPADVVTDGVDGYLVKNRDINEFANRVCQLIDNIELCKQLGLEAIKSSKRFKSETIMPKWIELYESICK